MLSSPHQPHLAEADSKTSQQVDTGGDDDDDDDNDDDDGIPV